MRRNAFIQSDKDSMKTGIIFISVIIAVIIITIVVFRVYEKDKLSPSGSNWFIVQYSNDGSIINTWSIYNKTIETKGNGLMFTDQDGYTTYLSGNYVCIESPTQKIKDKYLKPPEPK